MQYEKLQKLGYQVEIAREAVTIRLHHDTGVVVAEDDPDGEDVDQPTIYHVSGHGVNIYINDDDEETFKRFMDSHDERVEANRAEAVNANDN